MDHNPESDGPWIADQPTYPRLHAYFSRSKSSIWYDERYILTYTAVVPPKDWEDRFDPDLAYFAVAF
jgi:hypothetical protein